MTGSESKRAKSTLVCELEILALISRWVKTPANITTRASFKDLITYMNTLDIRYSWRD